MNKETLSIAEQFQNECHETVSKLADRETTASYQDFTNVWLFKKLAEFEMRLKQLESRSLNTYNP